jgi:hypothetical protein
LKIKYRSFRTFPLFLWFSFFGGKGRN